MTHVNVLHVTTTARYVGGYGPYKMARVLYIMLNSKWIVQYQEYFYNL